MKRTLAFLLMVVMLVSVITINAVTVQAQATVPEGYTAVRTVLDLYKVRYNLAGNYILMNDIDLSEATAPGGDYDYYGNGWNPIGSNDVYSNGAFTGTFDGNGYTISGLRMNVTSLPSGTGIYLYFGLFANNAGTIKNLHVQGSIEDDVYTDLYAGGIAAKNSGTIENCSNNVTIDSYNYCYAWIGGITGYNSGSVEACYNGADINGAGSSTSSYEHRYVGGISGYGASGSVIENCYNLGDIYAKCTGSGDDAYAGGIQGDSYGSSSNKAVIKNCYNVGSVTASGYSSSYTRKYAITYI